MAGTEAQIAQLEAEAQMLEARLAELRSSIAALRAQQQQAMTCPAEEPPIALQPLPPNDPLRTKWQLGYGLPPAQPQQAYSGYPGATRFGAPPAPATPQPPRPANPASGQLRLSGTLDSGQPWECLVPFSAISRPGGMSLGRSRQDADIVLPDNGTSRCHALMEMTEAGLVISDLGSTNGTYVNNRPISPCDGRVPLSHGMLLSFGATLARVEFI